MTVTDDNTAGRVFGDLPEWNGPQSFADTPPFTEYVTPNNDDRRDAIIHDVLAVRLTQDGSVRSLHDDVGATDEYDEVRREMTEHVTRETEAGRLTWSDLLLQSVSEVLVTDHPPTLRAKLVGHMALVMEWAEDVSRRIDEPGRVPPTRVDPESEPRTEMP